ncbi:MAG: CDP-alcohol phosphatidyltransferase family protein [Candidatus Bathyarchaeota archaeon]|nr:CDP-alcohol phosphatidyltransferase family protein [Candidatus Bathyarchaeota archaeon]
MEKKILIPQGISALRLAALPLFLYLFSIGALNWCIVVFGLAQISDLIDGYVARKLDATSKLGGYFDAATDFVFIIGIFGAFTAAGYYPPWLIALIAASFAQFVLTSRLSTKLYDPLGKYIGSALYIGIALTLLSPTQPILNFVQYAFLVFFGVSLISRIKSLNRERPAHVLYQKTTQQPKKIQAPATQQQSTTA